MDQLIGVTRYTKNTLQHSVEDCLSFISIFNAGIITSYLMMNGGPHFCPHRFWCTFHFSETCSVESGILLKHSCMKHLSSDEVCIFCLVTTYVCYICMYYLNRSQRECRNGVLPVLLESPNGSAQMTIPSTLTKQLHRSMRTIVGKLTLPAHRYSRLL